MANKLPVKAIFSGNDVTSLGEFASGDTIAASIIDGLDAVSLPLAGGALTGALVGTTAAFANNSEEVVTISRSTTTANSQPTTLAFTALKSNSVDGALSYIKNEWIDNTHGSLDSKMGFWTRDDNTLGERLTIKESNVGIGVTSPAAKLEVNGNAIAKTDTDATNTGNVTLDFSANQNFVLTLTGNVTLVNPTTETTGQSGFIAFIQDGTGSRTVSLGTDYETAGAAGLTLTATASATDLVPYLVVASNRILLGTPQLAFA